MIRKKKIPNFEMPYITQEVFFLTGWKVTTEVKLVNKIDTKLLIAMHAITRSYSKEKVVCSLGAALCKNH